jgi:hypothetical protein
MRECTPVGKYLYRVHDNGFESRNAEHCSYDHVSDTYCFVYKVLHVTECGAWIKRGDGKKFVLLDARKTFACETVDLAVESFRARKVRQMSIMRARIHRIESARNLVASKAFAQVLT